MALTKKQLTAAEALLNEATEVKLALMKLAGNMRRLADSGGDDDQPTIHAILAAAAKEAGISAAKVSTDSAANSCLDQMATAGMDKAKSTQLVLGTHVIPAYNFTQVSKSSAKLTDRSESSFLRVLEVIVKHSRHDAIEKRLSAKGFTPSMLEECAGLVGIETSDSWSVTKAKD